jgi:integrase
MLNDTLIRSLKPADTPKKYADSGGLFLYVPTTGSKLWRMAYRYNKKSKLLSFGEYPTVSLKMARERREEAKKLLADDIDPGLYKKQIMAARIAEETNVFQNIAMDWYDNHTKQLAQRTRDNILARFKNHIFPVLGKIPITKLEAPDLLALAKSLEQREQSVLAHTVLQQCGRVFRYGIATGIIKHNIVADLRGAVRPSKTSHRATIVNAKEVGKLLLALDNCYLSFPIKSALRLFPLLFVRSSELREAEWNEFDFENREWRIPAHRMKMPYPHIVPLARQSMEIFQSLKEYSGKGKYVFVSGMKGDTPLCPIVILKAFRRIGYAKEEMCVHGFRAMASTLLNELGYNYDWIERQLAHKERNSIRAAYNYADYLPERRRMMTEWADYLDELRKQALQSQLSEATATRGVNYVG